METFFEGAEKNLKILFNVPSTDPTGLLQISTCEWSSLLAPTKVTILSSRRTLVCRAYLLSESSLFVYRNKVILKTCGCTTIFSFLRPLVSFISERLSCSILTFVYTHQSFLRPERQPVPYRSFPQEIAFLDDFFSEPEPGSGSLILPPGPGRHWQFGGHFLLYVKFFTSDTDTPPPDTESDPSPSPDTDTLLFSDLFTWEIVMRNLNQESIQIYGPVNLPVQEVRSQSKIESILFTTSSSDTDGDPETDDTEGDGDASGDGVTPQQQQQQQQGLSIDDFAFSPCGYSLNAVTTSGDTSGDTDRNMDKKGWYYTIHVTPQKEFSYVSYETNFGGFRGKGGVKQAKLAQKVVGLFRPGNFIIWSLQKSGGFGGGDGCHCQQEMELYEGYEVVQREIVEVGNGLAVTVVVCEES